MCSNEIDRVAVAMAACTKLLFSFVRLNSRFDVWWPCQAGLKGLYLCLGTGSTNIAVIADR